jgi:putative zinc finger protein
MANERSTSWTTSKESFPAMVFERAKDPRKRRWTCPADEVIAAYVDGALREEKKRRVETHLAKCEWCRSSAADVVKLQRDLELPAPPFEAANRILAVSPRERTGSRWIWAPAAALVLIVIVAVIFAFRQEPQKLALTSAPTPSSQMIAEVEPATPSKSAIHEITRQPVIRSIVPVVLSPLQDSTVKRDQLELTWKPLSRSRYYDVSVVTSDGDLLWTGKTKSSSLRLPREVVLKRGSYFVWITAYLNNGQVAKSSPVRFVVDH